MTVHSSHPRYHSLILREKIVKAHQDGYLADSGMIAHGRGEAFDYLLGEKTITPAMESIKCAAATLLLAKEPVISVNGNTVALVAKEIVDLANLIPAKIEINLYYRTPQRVEKIESILKKIGADEVLGGNDDEFVFLKGLEGPRSKASGKGVNIADVVFVPLEDGDRAEALIANQKKIITVDLNPLSRTARKSTITIVDNVVRALPLLIDWVEKLKKEDEQTLKNIIEDFNNQKNLEKSLKVILYSHLGDVEI